MKRTVETLKSEHLLQDDLLVYVNRATEDFSVPLHNHDFIEFAYIAEGGGFHHIGDEVHRVGKGELCFIPIGLSHVFRPVSTDLSKHSLIVYNCIFSPKLLSKADSYVASPQLKQFITELSEGSLRYFSIHDRDGLIEKLFLSMHREYTLFHEHSSDLLHAMLLQLLITVQRFRLGYHALPDSQQSGRFEQILTFIDRHFSEDLSLSRLSAHSQLSERQLQRLFIQHTEQSFSRYLQSLRIQRSCELLRSTQLTVKVIAIMVGYKDFGSFLSVFKRIVGMTPMQYRKASL